MGGKDMCEFSPVYQYFILHPGMLSGSLFYELDLKKAIFDFNGCVIMKATSRTKDAIVKTNFTLSKTFCNFVRFLKCHRKTKKPNS